ncbi:MAG: hypothetical protein MH321_07570 [Leptospiraceae bacterium]|nr:hypothetical protein [Leptospiraceae bacterium]
MKKYLLVTTLVFISLFYGFCSSKPPVKQEPAPVVEEPKPTKEPVFKDTFKPRERDFK